MQVNIQATKLNLTADQKKYIVDKMNMLEKYLGDIDVINCDFEIELVKPHQQTGDIYRAEVNLKVPGELLRVEKTEADMVKAIDKVKDHMHRSIKRYKEKKLGMKRRK